MAVVAVSVGTKDSVGRVAADKFLPSSGAVLFFSDTLPASEFGKISS